MAKKFQGSLAILIILIICCWPAAIIYFFMKRDEEMSGTRMCTGCGIAIPMQYAVCPNCGKPAVQQYNAPPPQQYNAPPPQQYNAPQPSGQGQFCKSCGNRMDQGEQFCSKCGNRQ